MMRHILLPLAVLLIGFSSVTYASGSCRRTLAEASQNFDESDKRGILALEERGQKTVTCNGHEHVVPPSFMGKSFRFTEDPNECDGAFLNIPEANCGPDRFSVEVAAAPYCHGAHVCSAGSFSMSPVTNQLAHHQLREILSQYTKSIQIREGIEGFYLVGVCYAYCNEDRLLWEMDGKVFTLSGDGDLVRAANDYIEAATLFRDQQLTGKNTNPSR